MKFLVTILVGAMIFISNKITAQKQTITVKVENVTSDKGTVMFALYDKENFNLKPLQSAVGKIIAGKTTVTFKDVEAGEYAVICYHDSNSNNKMDFEPTGRPIEDYGASNNVRSFGPPTYDNTKFTVSDKDVSLKINF
jgi:uncharacterized protein (DUF2141 family)